MKLCHFSGAIEVAPRNSWIEQLGFDVTYDGKLNFRYPYGDITPEQAAAVSKFVETITDAYNKLTKQIDATNKRLKLEQYAPIVPPIVETNGSDFDLDAKSAVSQSARGVSGVVDSYSIASTEPEVLGQSVRGGSEGIDNCPPSMEDAKDDEEKLQAMLASGLKEEEKSAIETDVEMKAFMEAEKQKSLASQIEDNAIESLELK